MIVNQPLRKVRWHWNYSYVGDIAISDNDHVGTGTERDVHGHILRRCCQAKIEGVITSTKVLSDRRHRPFISQFIGQVIIART